MFQQWRRKLFRPQCETKTRFEWWAGGNSSGSSPWHAISFLIESGTGANIFMQSESTTWDYTEILQNYTLMLKTCRGGSVYARTNLKPTGAITRASSAPTHSVSAYTHS